MGRNGKEDEEAIKETELEGGGQKWKRLVGMRQERRSELRE